MTIAAGLLRRLPTASMRALRSRPLCRAALAAPPRAYRPAPAAVAAFSMGRRAMADDPHENETFEEFTARYENEFEAVNDVFELQRNLNNAFAYDLVPSVSVVAAALRACRRVNDFPTAVRTLEGLREKVENESQYNEYLRELEPLREELGISLKEAMYPDNKKW